MKHIEKGFKLDWNINIHLMWNWENMNINSSSIFQPSSCIQEIEPESIRWVREKCSISATFWTQYKCRHDKRPGNTDTVKLEYAKRTKRRSEKMWNGILRFTKIHILYVVCTYYTKIQSGFSCFASYYHTWMNEISERETSEKEKKKIARRETIWWIHIYLPHFLSSARLFFRRQMCRYIIDRIELYTWTILQ